MNCIVTCYQYTNPTRILSYFSHKLRKATLSCSFHITEPHFLSSTTLHNSSAVAEAGRLPQSHWPWETVAYEADCNPLTEQSNSAVLQPILSRLRELSSSWTKISRRLGLGCLKGCRQPSSLQLCCPDYLWLEPSSPGSKVWWCQATSTKAIPCGHQLVSTFGPFQLSVQDPPTSLRRSHQSNVRSTSTVDYCSKEKEKKQRNKKEEICMWIVRVWEPWGH